MNPGFKTLLVFIICLEISFKASLTSNLLVISVCLIYLLIHQIRLTHLLILLTSTFLPAISVFLTLTYFSNKSDFYYAWVLSSRIYVYLLSFTALTQTCTGVDLARSLEQNFHLPAKFAYGVLAALNLFPQMQQTIKKIHYSAMMRHTYLSFWSPNLYFKAILVAFKSATNLATAMQSHGFSENTKRSRIVIIKISFQDYCYLILSMIIFNLCLFYFN